MCVYSIYIMANKSMYIMKKTLTITLPGHLPGDNEI